MAFFAQTGPEGYGGMGGALGKALGDVMASTVPSPEQLVQQKRLSTAFAKLNDPNIQTYEEQLAAVAPTLLSTPGGAEALNTLAPIMQQRAKNRAVRDAISKRKAGIDAPIESAGETEVQKDISSIAKREQELPESQADTRLNEKIPRKPPAKFRSVEEEYDEENLYPQVTTGPQIQKTLSPKEIENYALDLMQASDETGSPMSYEQALNLANAKNDSILKYNDQIQKEQEMRDQRIKDMSTGVINRAENAKLIKEPEDNTVLSKLGYKYRNEKNPADLSFLVLFGFDHCI